MQEDLNYYIYHFSHLHTARYKGKAAPHKAVLLLSVIELIEDEQIRTNTIELSDILIDKFQDIWNRYKGTTSIFTPDIGKPFFHMQHEPFWNLVEHGENNSELIGLLGLPRMATKLPSTSKYSVKSLRESFCYAEINEGLLSLIKEPESSTKLKNTLINTYLIIKEPTSGTLSAMDVAA